MNINKQSFKFIHLSPSAFLTYFRTYTTSIMTNIAEKVMRVLISILCICSGLLGCTENTITKNPPMKTSETSCRLLLSQFFKEYDSVIRSRDIDKLEDYIDDGSRRWGKDKVGILKRVRNNFGVITQYDVTIKQCKTIDKNTILWEGFADYGIGITPHSMGTGLIRTDGKWRMRVIEYRP